MELETHRGWLPPTEADAALHALRMVYRYGVGEDRATGYLHSSNGLPWPASLARIGPQLLDGLRDLTGVDYSIAAFQAYLDGAGCDWHTDGPFSAQAILSLGVTRTFGVRPPGGTPTWIPVTAGDVVVMPPGFQTQWEHCVPVEQVTGERCSIVFRTPTPIGAA